MPIMHTGHTSSIIYPFASSKYIVQNNPSPLGISFYFCLPSFLHSSEEEEEDPGLSRTKFTLPPLEAPPAQVAFMLPVGQTARAARTHCSHWSRVMSMAAPSDAAFSVNLALRDSPTVYCGAPSQRVVEPVRPLQMASSAMFWSWNTMCLIKDIKLAPMYEVDRLKNNGCWLTRRGLGTRHPSRLPGSSPSTASRPRLRSAPGRLRIGDIWAWRARGRHPRREGRFEGKWW